MTTITLESSLKQDREQLNKTVRDNRLPHNLNELPTIQARFDAQQEQLEMDLKVSGVRQQMLAQRISRLGKEITSEAANDPVVQELERALQLREVNVNKLRQVHAQKLASQADLATAEAEFAERKAELAKYKREAAESAGGRQIADLRQRLDDVEMDMEEKKAQLEYIKQRKRQFGDLAALDKLRSDISLHEKILAELHAEKERLMVDSQARPGPTVTLVSIGPDRAGQPGLR